MITNVSMHNVSDVYVSSYSDLAMALTFYFKGNDGNRSEVTAYGIPPARAVEIISAMGSDAVKIYVDGNLMNIKEYAEEISVREVLNKMEEDDEA